MTRRTKHLPLSPVMAALFLIGGCAGESKPSTPAEAQGKSAVINTWLTAHSGDALPGIYKVESPDVLQITSPRIKEADGTKVTVRPDGKISLNLVGEIKVSGMTPAQISELLRQEYQKFYTRGSFDLSVRVVEYKSKSFFVAGQVLTPGVKKYTGNNTVLAVLAEAKLDKMAWPQKIIVIRASEDSTVKQKATVDVKAMYDKGDLSENFLIEEGDLVFVPPSPLAQLGMTFKKVLFPVAPATNIASIVLRGGI